MTSVGLALAVLRAQARGEPDREAAVKLARVAVVAGIAGAAALRVLDGDAWQRASVDVAEAVLDADPAVAARDGQAG